MTIRYLIFIASLTAVISSCGNPAPLTVEPISAELNQKFLTGKGLDRHYFGTRDVVQYYQVSNFSNLPAAAVLNKLNNFVNTHYRFGKTDSLQNLTVLFYRKQLLVNYSKLVYASARDNEYRTLDGQTGNLVARIQYTLLTGKRQVARRMLFYTNGVKQLAQADTISLTPALSKGEGDRTDRHLYRVFTITPSPLERAGVRRFWRGLG